jgi:ADP-heptose:LPS heptosyltransferase
MRVLFVSATRVGDAVLSTGLLDHLIRTHPEARFTVVCGPDAEGVFARMPQLDRVVILRKLRLNAHWFPLWTWAAARRWDLVVDLRGSALGWMVRTRERRVFRPRPGHKTEQLAAVLGLSDPPLPVAWTAPEDEAVAERLLPGGVPLVAMGPTAARIEKIWPAERFAEVFQALAADVLPGAVPVVLGGPGERERRLASPLIRALPTPVDLVGGLSLPQVAACLRRCCLYIGNDSGLMHLAAAAGTRTVGLFGPTSAAEYAAAGASAEAVVSPDLTMEGIVPEAVLLVASRMLERASDSMVEELAIRKGWR